MNLVTWAIVLTSFWLLLSGFFKPLLLSFGVLSVVLVLFLLKRMDSTDKQPQKLPFNLPFLRYITWLIGQIVLSSLEVVKLVWGNNKNISPAIAKLPVDNTPEKGRVLYANSITLTPGTLSVDIDDKHVTVHALNKKSISDLETGEMARKVTSASGEKS